MNIAYVSRSAAPRAGGIEAHLDRVARGLTRDGHRVRVWAARVDDAPFTRVNTTLGAQRFAPFERAGVETRPIPVGAAWRLAMMPVALGAIPGADRLGYDRLREATLPLVTAAIGPALAREMRASHVVHAWGGEPLMHAALRAARSLGVPFVITPFAHPGHWGDDALNARLYRAADRVVALLPGEAAFYESLGVPSERLAVIGVAAPEPADGVTAAEIRTRHALGETKLVLCLGVKRRYKYRALLDAVGDVPDPDVRFAFVGPETPESDADFAAVRDPRVLRIGKVDEHEKWGWLRAANVLCLPSVSEIMPVSILEAWRTGTAVVVAEGRFTRDLVADGEDGIVCEPGAIAPALKTLLADPEAAGAMGRAGAAKVAARYEPAVVVERHEALYRDLT